MIRDSLHGLVQQLRIQHLPATQVAPAAIDPPCQPGDVVAVELQAVTKKWLCHIISRAARHLRGDTEAKRRIDIGNDYVAEDIKEAIEILREAREASPTAQP